jgi:Kdo2-lipid IVA lauroyltransferase/acyltransferase
MQNKIEYILFIGFSYLAKLLGLNLSRKFASGLAYFFYYFIPIRKKMAIENISKAFPEYSKKKVRQIALGTYKSFSITIMETLFIPHISKREMIKSVDFANKEILLQKISERKGAIVLSAHFGNWEYLAASLALQLDFPLVMLIKVQRNPYVTRFMDKARTKWSNEIIPVGTAVRKIFQELMKGRFAIMAADQRGNVDGIRVKFLGIMSSVYSGPAVIATKTGTDIILAISVRQPDYSYKVELTELPLNALPENYDEKIKEICSRYLGFLEKFIRQHPEQWLWLHNRWKY